MELKQAEKIYKMKDKDIYALNKIDFKIDETKGGFYVIKGHSGSGKTTLIQILGLLDTLTNGQYILENQDVNTLDENAKAEIRMKKIGFIFQSFQLNPYLKAYENVMIPMMINNNIPSSKRKMRAIELLKKVKLEDRINHFPKELSGGEQQRVAIARALANNPSIILADEPTGNLDVENEQYIFEMLKDISKSGKCVIVVSHNESITNYADYVFEMENGNIKRISL